MMTVISLVAFPIVLMMSKPKSAPAPIAEDAAAAPAE
jgi:hypothetical protein